jgi:thioredoxin 1
MSKAAAVSGATFDKEVLQSSVPVLVDFWAPWCPPCRAIAPSLDAIAEEYAGRAKVVKVNTDEEYDLTMRYGISNIPALLYFKDGELKDQIIGAAPQHAIAEKLAKLIG